MKVMTPGHRYELANFDQDIAELNQVLQFIQKEPDPHDPEGRMLTVKDGTTNEEVLRVLIDRLKCQNAKVPCRENSIVTTKLEECLMWLEKRTADRRSRGVEGKPVA